MQFCDLQWENKVYTLFQIQHKAAVAIETSTVFALCQAII